MAYEVVLRIQFRKRLEALLEFLEENWGKNVAGEFLEKVLYRLDQISRQPKIGIASQKFPEVRSVLVSPHNRIYYRVKGNRIEILALFDTRQHPRRNRCS